MVFNEMPEQQPEIQFSEYTLADGTVVQIDKLEQGGKVMIGESPAPAGDHMLLDGSKITVDETGTIVAVAMPEAPETPEPEDMGAKFAAFETRFAEMQSEFTTIKTENGNLKQAVALQDQAIKGLIELCERLVNEPTTTPAEQPTRFRKTETTEDKAQKLFKLFKNK